MSDDMLSKRNQPGPEYHFNHARYWWFTGWLDAKHEQKGWLP